MRKGRSREKVGETATVGTRAGGSRGRKVEGDSFRPLPETPRWTPPEARGQSPIPLSPRGLLPRHNRLITPDYVPVFRRVRVCSWPCRFLSFFPSPSPPPSFFPSLFSPPFPLLSRLRGNLVGHFGRALSSCSRLAVPRSSGIDTFTKASCHDRPVITRTWRVRRTSGQKRPVPSAARRRRDR